MALKTQPERVEGVYKDNLPRVGGVEVEIKKAKRYESRMGSRGEVELKKKKTIFFVFENIRGPTRFEVRTQPFPGNDARKLVGYFNDAN